MSSADLNSIFLSAGHSSPKCQKVSPFRARQVSHRGSPQWWHLGKATERRPMKHSTHMIPRGFVTEGPAQNGSSRSTSSPGRSNLMFGKLYSF